MRTALALRSVNGGLWRLVQRPGIAKTLSSGASSGNVINDKQDSDPFESTEEFERRIFRGHSETGSKDDVFYQKLDELEKGYGRYETGFRGKTHFRALDGLDESLSTLSDGMDGQLTKAAMYFKFDPEEVVKEDYSFRPDVKFSPGTTYEPKDLDLTKPAVRKFVKRDGFEVTTEEVLRQADFRNVRFLAKFITEAGIIIKRSQTRISAKAQRKVAREIKTARAFGLLPFTTMGKKSFVFGKTMEARDVDYEYETFGSPSTADVEDPLGA